MIKENLGRYQSSIVTQHFKSLKMLYSKDRKRRRRRKKERKKKVRMPSIGYLSEPKLHGFGTTCTTLITVINRIIILNKNSSSFFSKSCHIFYTTKNVSSFILTETCTNYLFIGRTLL